MPNCSRPQWLMEDVSRPLPAVHTSRGQTGKAVERVKKEFALLKSSRDSYRLPRRFPLMENEENGRPQRSHDAVDRGTKLLCRIRAVFTEGISQKAHFCWIRGTLAAKISQPFPLSPGGRTCVPVLAAGPRRSDGRVRLRHSDLTLREYGVSPNRCARQMGSAGRRCRCGPHRDTPEQAG